MDFKAAPAQREEVSNSYSLSLIAEMCSEKLKFEEPISAVKVELNFNPISCELEILENRENLIEVLKLSNPKLPLKELTSTALTKKAATTVRNGSSSEPDSLKEVKREISPSTERKSMEDTENVLEAKNADVVLPLKIVFSPLLTATEETISAEPKPLEKIVRKFEVNSTLDITENKENIKGLKKSTSNLYFERVSSSAQLTKERSEPENKNPRKRSSTLANVPRIKTENISTPNTKNNIFHWSKKVDNEEPKGFLSKSNNGSKTNLGSSLKRSASNSINFSSSKNLSPLLDLGLPNRKSSSLIHRLFQFTNHDSNSTSNDNYKIKTNLGAETEVLHFPGFSIADPITPDHNNLNKSEALYASRTNSTLSKFFHFNVSNTTPTSPALTASPRGSADNLQDTMLLLSTGASSSVTPIQSVPSTKIHEEENILTPIIQKFNVLKSHKFHNLEENTFFKDVLTSLHIKANHKDKEKDKDEESKNNTGISLSRSVSMEKLNYGIRDEVLGKGANATVKLAHQKIMNIEKLYAVKEFRKRRKEETEREYVKKVIGEFCISLHHENVIVVIDLIQDEKDRWCQIMEYLAGGDLYGRISKRTLTDKVEINCYFKQLMCGVQYLHSVGVAHRDLKPENLLLDETGRILKITDFGCAKVFKTCFEKTSRTVKGKCGSDPYIAPEEFDDDAEYESLKVDIWACGIILFAMYQKTVPWHLAKQDDHNYAAYTKKRHYEGYGFLSFDKLPEGPRSIIYKLLEPNPKLRPSTAEIFENYWFNAICYCHLVKTDELNNSCNKSFFAKSGSQLEDFNNEKSNPVLNEVNHTHLKLGDH
ncbi:serine/threonine-protein kinase HAL4/sat4 [Clydaea vesicula]|uniref:non-specific serine/threonine protein kinase n=1 Tax=Clydaea vesicula TaxID=447962 RepID=A0AAD5XY11_9FUNG|nr:serine/threonine-protein kinase HAL4/sat4 [Clydaea vesicula]